MGLVDYVPEPNFYKVEEIFRYLYALLFYRLLIAQNFTSHVLLTIHHVDYLIQPKLE